MRFYTQEESSFTVSLRRRISYLQFHYIEGQPICSFTTQEDSSSAVLHIEIHVYYISHLRFHYIEGQPSTEVSLHRRISSIYAVSLHRRVAHLQFLYTEKQFICSFTTLINSSSAVSLHIEHSSCPASLLSCIHHALHPSCRAFLMSYIPCTDENE